MQVEKECGWRGHKGREMSGEQDEKGGIRRGGCMQAVQPRREGRMAAGIGSSRPSDARLC